MPSVARRNRCGGDCVKLYKRIPGKLPRYALFLHDVLRFLKRLPNRKIFDLVVTSPPYNIGKEYERRVSLEDYVEWQTAIINEITPRLRESGSVCWQVGNYIENGVIEPLDIWIHPTFRSRGLELRNRIVWRYGHGLHCQRRFSGRYETILWYTKSDQYTFNLDAVRVPSKYPGKRHYKGPNRGEVSSNPNGKNPEDVWDACWDLWEIPNIKGSHKEKTGHPCQFPVGLVERLVLALTHKRDLVFDPFAGVASAGVAAGIHGRDFWGCDIVEEYLQIGKERVNAALNGTAHYRPHDQPLYDHRTSPLAIAPKR